MGVAFPEALRTSLLMAAAEIGDKTFFVTMLLSMRYKGLEEKSLVFAGSLFGVILSAFVSLVSASQLVGSPALTIAFGSSSVLDLIGFALFLMLGLRMAYEARMEEEEEDMIKLPTSRADFDTNPYASYLEDTNPFSADLIADHPNPFAKDAERYVPDYGATCDPKASRGWKPTGKNGDGVQSSRELFLSRACIAGLAFFCALLAEVGDKSATVLTELQVIGHQQAWATVLGTLLAFSILNALAVFFGLLLQQRYAAGGRALLLAALISFVLALISLSEGLTALPQARQWLGFLQVTRTSWRTPGA